MNYQIIRSDSLSHHGIKGMSWGVQNGPPYPLNSEKHAKVLEKAKKAKKKLDNAKDKSEKTRTKKVEAKRSKLEAKKQKYESEAAKAESKENKYKVKSYKAATRLLFPNMEKSQEFDAKSEAYKYQKIDYKAKAKAIEGKLASMKYDEMLADSKVKRSEAKVDKYLKQLEGVTIDDLDKD